MIVKLVNFNIKKEFVFKFLEQLIVVICRD